MVALSRARAPRPPQPGYQQKATVATLPAVTGGWNKRDPLSAMPVTDAITLDNLIPGPGGLSLRNGYSTQSTGLGSYVESLMQYSGPGGTNKLFGAVPTAIYNCSVAGAVGAADVSSLTNGRWQHTMFASSAANYLVCCNGADDVREYDGTTWTSPVITGVTSANLIHVAAHVQRLWFVEKDKLDAWYLGVSAISGAATKLPLGSYCKLGGYLMAIGSWSRDGGSGPDDLIVFVTSKGEVIIYSGTDPSSSTTWQQVGVFRIAPPIGRRCIVKAGADLGILTAVGVIPLSRVLESNLSGQALVAITDKISDAFREYYQRSGAYFGWQVIEHPQKQLVFVNVPHAERATQYQFVMNVQTGAWCRFTGLSAGCWSLFGDNLYFGDNSGNVWKYSSDYLDSTMQISAVVQQAFSDFGSQQIKRFVEVRALTRAPTGYTASVEMKVDYDTSPPTAAGTVASSGASLWNSALWNVALWAPASVPQTSWQTVNGIGKVGSPALSVALSQEFFLNQMDVMFEPGGYF